MIEEEHVERDIDKSAFHCRGSGVAGLKVGGRMTRA